MKTALVALALAGVAGCAPPQTRHEIVVGDHRITFSVDPSWRAADQGKRCVVRKGEEQLVIEDLGPANRDGVGHAIEAARDLWRRGHAEEGRTLLGMVPVSSDLFATPEQRRAFWDAWSEARTSPEEIDRASMEERFDRLLDATNALRDLRPEEIYQAALRSLGETERRAESSRESRSDEGRLFVRIDSWDLLSHQYPKHFAFALDRGNLLVVRTDTGLPERAAPAFDQIWKSLRYVPAATAAGGSAARRSNT